MKLKKATLMIACLGVVDAIYLSIIKFTNNKAMCIPGVGDCWSVNNSRYSEFFGIPISIFGALAYLCIIGLLLFSKKNKILAEYASIFIFGISLVGFLFSMYLTYLQFAVINAVCPFCILSACTMTTVFILSLINLVREQKELT